MTHAILSMQLWNMTGVWKPGEESPVFFFGSFFLIIMAPTLWLTWYSFIWQVSQLASSDEDRFVLYVAPPLCLLLIALCLVVQNPGDPVEWSAQLLFGFITITFWLGMLNGFLSSFGISASQDVAEHRNRAAGWPIAGAQLGLTLCFAGTVVGHGRPGQVCVALLPGILGTLVLFGLWAILESLTHLSDAITIDRDGGAALRLTGFLVALGLILGQIYRPSTAEEWIPWVRFICPIGLLLAALLVETWYKRVWDWTFGGPRRRDRWIFSLYLVAAGLCIYLTR